MLSEQEIRILIENKKIFSHEREFLNQKENDADDLIGNLQVQIAGIFLALVGAFISNTVFAQLKTHPLREIFIFSISSLLISLIFGIFVNPIAKRRFWYSMAEMSDKCIIKVNEALENKINFNKARIDCEKIRGSTRSRTSNPWPLRVQSLFFLLGIFLIALSLFMMLYK